MSRILLDQNVPRALAVYLTGYAVRTAAEQGWAELENGELMRVAHDAGFVLMITCDKNIGYQQNMSERPIGLVVLSTTHWPTLRASERLILDAVRRLKPKGYTYVECGGAPGPQDGPATLL